MTPAGTNQRAFTALAQVEQPWHAPRFSTPRRRTVVVWGVAMFLALAWDRAAWLHVSVKDPSRLALMESKDWYRLLRIGGFVGTWVIVALLFWLHDAAALRRIARRSHAEPDRQPASDTRRLDQPSADSPGPDGWWRRGVFPLVGAALAGGMAEILKPLIGRFRPDQTLANGEHVDGWFVLAPPGERVQAFGDNALGLASSHAAVAFGAAASIGLMLPPLRPILYAFAAGCALTRVLSGAHFVSDTVIAAMLGVGAAHLLWNFDARGRQQRRLGTNTKTSTSTARPPSSPDRP